MPRKAKQEGNEPTSASVTKAHVATNGVNKMADETSIIEFSEDLNDALPPVPLPVGDYTAEIRGAVKKVSAKGNDYASVQFFIPPEQYPADYTDGNPDGTILPFNRVTLGDTVAERYRVKKFVESIGGKLGRTLNLNDWVGLTAKVSIVHDTYEGETRAQIAKVGEA